MNRRTFMTTTAAAAFATTATTTLSASAKALEKGPFQLKYAPHFGMFKALAGDDMVDQLKFCADEGFRAWEDNGMMGRDVAHPGKARGRDEGERHRDGRLRRSRGVE